ncbi:hypothetical protein [Streptomyces chiangmaiensis]|uniref:Uncharacterized protein n=1 Tax=Streptomyces chiangmaiensis TaxID=766497 RepID=A0ABU7FVY4_9ACTN|nr:hypothetical protein [Streptomyces chiangmaiensis]MED7828088.1 hypothetical protein [Streptomyces chiangmaiensis]
MRRDVVVRLFGAHTEAIQGSGNTGIMDVVGTAGSPSGARCTRMNGVTMSN